MSETPRTLRIFGVPFGPHAVEHLTDDPALADYLLGSVCELAVLRSLSDGVHELPVGSVGLTSEVVTIRPGDRIELATREGRDPLLLWRMLPDRDPEPTERITVIKRAGVIVTLWAGGMAPPHPVELTDGEAVIRAAAFWRSHGFARRGRA